MRLCDQSDFRPQVIGARHPQDFVNNLLATFPRRAGQKLSNRS
ncbi:hypothetical protein AHFPHNDE_04151 [Pseudomonas sp. MM227]|nr:hypothetical protein AHFPHNDE_04151 [Pseudomonas sp. MM227]